MDNHTAVYETWLNKRAKLWSIMEEIAQKRYILLWLLMGDFNTSLFHQKEVEEQRPSLNEGWKISSIWFINVDLLIWDFQDANSLGAEALCLKGQIGLLLVLHGVLSFQRTVVSHLFKSNHRPILACMDPDQPVNLRMRAFRFLSSWLTNHDFDCNVHEDRNKVNETNHQNSRITDLTVTLRQWDRDVFGHIGKRKRELVRRLAGIDRKIAQRENRYLRKMQGDLWNELENTLFHEELLWFQKSHCKWMRFGDHNLKYFHGTTIIRRQEFHSQTSK